MRRPLQGHNWPRYTNESNGVILFSNHKEKHGAVAALPVQNQTNKKQILNQGELCVKLINGDCRGQTSHPCG